MRKSPAVANQSLSALTAIASRLRWFHQPPGGDATSRKAKAALPETGAPQTGREFAQAAIRSCRTLW